MRMKSIKTVLLLFAAAFIVGCGIDNTDENTVGSNLVSATVVEDINASTMLAVVQANIDANATNAFGYKAVRIVYNTTTPNGDTVQASGLLVIPEATDAYKQYLASQGKSFSVSAICENHGTIFLNSEAPSELEQSNGLPDYSTAVLMTGYAGFATIAPDYLGYGVSNKKAVHPYIMKSSAQASLDMITASLRYMQDNGIAFNGQLFISGYSEGGYIAMALAEEIEQNHSSELKIKGVAPMAGPYDVEKLGIYELNATKVMEYPAFLAEIAWSYASYYDDVSLDSSIVVGPSAFNSQDLFGGDYDAPQIHALLGLSTNYGFNTYTTDQLFTSSFINDFQNNVNNPVRVHFEENNVYKNWTPKTKVNLIHCVDDEIIPYGISAQVAYDSFSARDADVSITPIPSSMIPAASASAPFVHQRCGSVAYGAAVQWFDAIRKGDIQ